jgi:MFS superfamily sulfate permease-like transporter
MAFCNIVGHASRHTAGPMGPSTMDLSNAFCFWGVTVATSLGVYYANRGRPVDKRGTSGHVWQNRRTDRTRQVGEISTASAMNWTEVILERLTHASASPVQRSDERVLPSLAASWRADVPAAIVVSLIAVPLCLGIALASGAPLFSGVISGIVGGVVVGSLSGSPLMVSGPAAGLSAIVMTAIATLGSYRAFLAAVVVGGLLQMVLAACRAGIVGYYFPSSVIRGMLTAIGLILILKQIPHALGYDVNFEGDESFLQTNAENTFSAIASAAARVEPAALLLSLLGLLLLVAWDRGPLRHLRLWPGALAAVLLGIVGQLLLPFLNPAFQLGPEHLVGLPVPQSIGDVGLFATPDWSALMRPEAWRIAVTLAIVASLETLLTLDATDRMDRYKREAPSDRELAVQGVGNVVAGFLGGLPITGVLVRSAANVDAGAQTKMSTVLHGLLMAGAVFLIPVALNMIPLASLAAILIYTGIKLAQPTAVRHIWQQGRSQFLPFLVTVSAILLTDLLIGILIGLGVGFMFVLFDHLRYPCYTVVSGAGSVLKRVRLHEQVTFLNKASLARLLDELPQHSRVELDGSSCRHIDHDVLEFISDFRRTAALREIDFRIVGIVLPPISPSH